MSYEKHGNLFSGLTPIFIALVIGLIAGYAWSYHANALTPSKVYEDGSYVGCIKDAICND